MRARKYLYFITVLLFVSSATAQEPSRPSSKVVKNGISCNEFAQPVKKLFGQSVGVEQCQIISEETLFNIKGQKFRRLEVRLSGGMEGWASREKGSRAIYFTDGPDFVWSNQVSPDRDRAATAEERQRFAKQIDITRMLYAGDTGDYVKNKRENARMLAEKGLASKHRLYELKGVSHFDAGQVSRPDLVSQTLDLGGFFDALIDRLDEWVDKNTTPTPSKVDAADRDGKARGEGAVALPEVACPLGVYFTYPPEVDPGRRGGQETAFAAFDGTNLEPLDARGNLVDMNGNGVRDKRETPSQAWQRLGLLKSGQKLIAATYQSCVKDAAARLVKEGLLPVKVGEFYIEKGANVRLLN